MVGTLPPRHLVLKALAVATDAPQPPPTDIDDGIPLVDPGLMQITSFFEPGLVAGAHSISVSQRISLDVSLDSKTSNVQTRDLVMRGGSTTAQQKFYVVAPQFSIPVEDFHSTYPPQGHADQPNIAPHVVLADPHLPWERPVFRDDSDTEDMVPWLALFPFDVNHPDSPELRLTTDQLADIKTALNLAKVPVPSATFSISTTVKDYMAITKNTTVKTVFKIPDFSRDDNWSSIKADETPVEVIFLSGKLFKDLFYVAGVLDQKHFRYCAHVRNVNTTGVTGAGLNDTGLYSIVHSKRSGPLDIAQGKPPRSQAVHMVSLESLQTLTDVKNTDVVPLISLYRWTYLCQPPLSVNFIDSMRAIGVQIKYSESENPNELDPDERAELNDNIKDTPPNSYLRCSKKVVDAVEGSNLNASDPMAKVRATMAQRMRDGYSLVRYRVQTGEETVGLFRGPLLPSYPGSPPDKWPYSSNNGQDYQIFDATLGMMNISYSSAWNLGRMMASSDVGFVSALMKIRLRSYQSGVNASGLSSAQDALGLKGKAHFFSTLPDTVKFMTKVSTVGGTGGLSARSRWDRPSENFDTSIDSDAFSAGVGTHVTNEGSAAGSGGSIPIQDLFAPTSVDWKVVHDWILDRMFLAGIPTHYLIPDPNFLPAESMRLFHIDNNWMDCFIDGALSCANHTALGNNDAIRDWIKSQFNTYLTTPVFKNPNNPSSGQLHPPQVPIYGFFLRSAVVSAFKDLVVDIPWKAGSDGGGKASILVQKRLGSDLLMVLLDRLPDKGDIKSIRFTQPPHQQRFCVADYLGPSGATYLFRKIYYDEVKAEFLSQFGEPARFAPGDANSIFDFNTRCINFSNLSSLLFDENFANKAYAPISNFFLGKDTDSHSWKNPESGPKHGLTSALVGLQLNDTMKHLEIIAPAAPGSSPPTPASPYTIRTRDHATATASAAAALKSIKEKRFDGTPTTHDTSILQPLKAPLQRMHPAALPATSTSKTPSLAAIGIRNVGPTPAPTPASVPTTQATSSPSSSSSSSSLGPQPPITTPHPLPIHLAAAAATVAPRLGTTAYKYAVYPREVPFASATDPKDPSKGGLVHTDAQRPVDLVFSVQQNKLVTSEASPAVRLRGIKFSIPLGPKAGRAVDVPTNPTLARSPGFAPLPDVQGAAGWAVRMLSNQRWVGVVDPGQRYLVVRLVARNMKRFESLPACEELGFILSGVDTGWTADPKDMDKDFIGVIGVQESYGTTDQNEQGVYGTTIQVQRKTGWTNSA